MRRVLVPAILLASILGGAVIYGCSAPDPGSLNWDDSPSGPATAHRPSSTTVPTVPTGTVGPVTDSGPAADSGPVTVFSGAPAYTPALPAGKSSTDQHGASGNAGQDCLQSNCHGPVSALAPRFYFAGTVIDNSKSGVAKAEVRVVDKSGTQIGLVNTDSVGNFWFKGDNVMPADAKVGVRNGTYIRLMSTPLTAGVAGSTGNGGGGACNSTGGTCHGGTTGPINLN